MKLEIIHEIDDEEEIHHQLEIKFITENMTISLNASELIGVNWLGFIENETFTLKNSLTDSYGSHCDNGYITIKKIDGKIIFDADSATGYGFTYTVDFEVMKDIFIEIDQYYKIYNNFN